MTKTVTLPVLGKVTPSYLGMLVITLLVILLWLVTLTMLFAGGGKLQEQAFENGQYARLIIATGAVEGNLPDVAPPPAEEQPPAAEEEEPVAEEETTDDEMISSEEPEEETPAAEEDEPITGQEEMPSEEAAPEEGAATEEAPVESTADAGEVVMEESTVQVSVPLKQALNRAMLETTPKGLKLPMRSENGGEPWEYYRKPNTSSDELPIVAIILTGLGLDEEATDEVAKRNEFLTMSFSPYAPNLPQQITRARSYGHEVWLDLPMEPEDYPASDAGPFTLMKDLPEEELKERLFHVLGSAGMYTGLVSFPPGEVFSGYRNMGMVAEELKNRGLLMLLRTRSYTSAKTEDHTLYMNRQLGVQTRGTNASTEQLLTELEAVARSFDYAIGVAAYSPEMLNKIEQWAATLSEKSLVLAPVSAVIERVDD